MSKPVKQPQPTRTLRYGPPLLLGALLIAGALGSLYYWHDAARVLAVGSLLGFTGTVFLLFITWLYVTSSRDQLQLFRDQWQEEHTVSPGFTLLVDRDEVTGTPHRGTPQAVAQGSTVPSDPTYLEVWNLGRRAFRAAGVRLTCKKNSRTREVPCHLFVRPDEAVRLDLTEPILRLLSLYKDRIEILEYPSAIRENVEVRLHVWVGRSNTFTAPEVFDVCLQKQAARIAVVVAEPAVFLEE